MDGFYIGTCFSFGVLALMYLTKGDKSLFTKITPVFGENQEVYDVTDPCTTLLDCIDVPDEGAEVKLITYNFPLKEWKEDGDFYKWVSEQLERNVRIRVIGGPEIEAEEAVKKLMKKGLDVRLFSKKPMDSHYFLISSPPQVWFEMHHEEDKAYECYLTKKPYEDIWKEVNELYEKLCEKTSTYYST